MFVLYLSKKVTLNSCFKAKSLSDISSLTKMSFLLYLLTKSGESALITIVL